MKKQPPKPKMIIVKGPKPTVFDLSFQKTSENTKIIVALESLKSNQGWQFMTQVVQANIDKLAGQIIDKVDEDGKTITDEQVDKLRFMHGYLKEFLAKPDRFLKDLTRTESPEEDLDPYERGKNG